MNYVRFSFFCYLLCFVAFFNLFVLLNFIFSLVCVRVCIRKFITIDFLLFFCPNQSKIQIYLLEFFFFASTQFLFSQWNSSVFFLIFKWSIRKNFQISLEKKDSMETCNVFISQLFVHKWISLSINFVFQSNSTLQLFCKHFFSLFSLIRTIIIDFIPF